MGINSYAICYGILEVFVQLHINVVSIIWKTFTSRLSTDFVKFSISSAPILCADWRSYPTAQLIYGCTLLTTSVRLSFQQTPEIHYWIKVRWWWRPCHQFFALESNFCQLFNSGTSSMWLCVVLHEDYLLPECWAFAAVPRNKLSWRKFPYCTLVSSSLRHLELWKGQQAHCQLSQPKTWHHHHLVVVSLLIVFCSPLQGNLCTSRLVHRGLLCTHLLNQSDCRIFVFGPLSDVSR